MRIWTEGDAGRPAMTVVIINWRRPDLTRAAIDSVVASELDDERGVEIVLVENEATPGSAAAVVSAHPLVRVVELSDNAGFAGGVTAGIAAAHAEILVLVNNDATVDRGFLAAGLSRLTAEGPLVAAVAAEVLLDREGEELVNSRGVEMTASANGFDRDWLVPAADGGRDGADDPFGFSGSAAFLRSAAVEAVGGFENSFFMYYEDVDLSWRLRAAGYRIVYEPGAVVRHRHAGSSAVESPLMRRYSMRNRMLAVLRNGSIRLVVAVLARGVFAATRDGILGAAGRAAGQRLDARTWRWLWRGVLASARSVAAARRSSGARAVVGRGAIERTYFGRPGTTSWR